MSDVRSLVECVCGMLVSARELPRRCPRCAQQLDRSALAEESDSRIWYFAVEKNAARMECRQPHHRARAQEPIPE